MDEITQKVVDGVAWEEFCDLLREAGGVIMAEANPNDPLDRAEGFRMLTRLLRGVLASHFEYAQPAHPTLICTCHETIKIVGENPGTTTTSAPRSTASTTIGSGGRGVRRSGSASTSSPVEALAAAGPVLVPPCTRNRCASSLMDPSR